MKLEQGAARKANEKERTRRKQARITKFEAMVKAEADRWTEELDPANAPRVCPYDDTSEGRIDLVHRHGCMPQTYTSTSRDQICADCREDEDMEMQERREMEWRRNQLRAPMACTSLELTLASLVFTEAILYIQLLQSAMNAMKC
ncbi:hypothetical protein BOTNAR_0034g00140 [Botryotinia narcissicola]|uniref:Uncharacterized protein n=1 Tax=Botryotinia narcissicola TaxID=278944 RepID=A0A4Z1J2D4_9HELO|nr:hypothetical protein BOTNAR_0034g00140 [Botryotinia narcissicola]